MADKRKIIMDVDTGSDDAIALVMSMLDERFDLLGICPVNGNVEVKNCTDNSLRVVECCGKENEVKVYRGADLPLCATLMPYTPQVVAGHPNREGKRPNEKRVHPDHLPLPEPKIKEDAKSAVAFYLETLLAAEDHSVTLVPVGPLTNVALAMRADPRIIDKIDEIMIMGGGYAVNNSTPAAEFNIFVDPEALEIVLQSGCKITLVPLDATHDAYITGEEAQEFRAIGTPPAKLVADLIEQRILGYSQFDADMQTKAPIHDALAVCALLYPEVLKDVEFVNVHVDISGGIGYGQTILDRRNRTFGDPKNCYFAHHADRELFRDWMLDVLRKDAAKRA